MTRTGHSVCRHAPRLRLRLRRPLARRRLDEVRAVVGAGVRTRSSDQHAPGSALVLLEEARRGWDAAAALHVAAQELGEARERAGRAEGEARVYAELVDELRARVALLERDLEQACATGSPRPTPAAPPASTTSSEHDDPAPARGWFGRRRP